MVEQEFEPRSDVEPLADESRPSTAGAISHKTKATLYTNLGLKQTKVFLGQDVLAKLAVIYEALYSESFDANKIDPLVVGDIIGACVNLYYNGSHIKKPSEGKPKQIITPKTANGQLLYRYHQIAQGTKEYPHALEITEALNTKKMKGGHYFPHIKKTVSNKNGRSIFLSPFNKADDRWSTAEIQQLRAIEFINTTIKEWNPKTKNSPDTSIKKRKRRNT